MDFITLLPKVVFIFFIPWLAQIIQINSLPWIAEHELGDQSKISQIMRKSNIQSAFEKRIPNSYEIRFNETYGRLRSLINQNDEKLYMNKINIMYDLLAEQIRKIGFSCPTDSAIKDQYCSEKYFSGFENDKQRSYCEKDVESSQIVYSYESNEYSFSDTGEIFLNYENGDLILDDPNCVSVVVDGDVLICGDLTIANGQLNTLTSFDAFEAQGLSIGGTQSMHAKKRCIIRKGITVRGSMILPFSNLIVIGKLIVGKNVYAADIQIDLSSNMFIGVLYLFSDIIQSSNITGAFDPFSLTRIKLFHLSNTCLSNFQNYKETDGKKIINKRLGSLWSGRKIYVGNSGKLWVRGDIYGGEVVITDAGIIFGVCGDLKTNTTHGLGIHIMDSGYLHMINSSVYASRLSVIRSSTLTVTKGELNINNILLLHSASKIKVGGGLLLYIASIRESSSLFAESLKVLNHGIIHIDSSSDNQIISNIFDIDYNKFEGSSEANKFNGYFQVIMASDVTIYGEVMVRGSIEINDGSEFVSMGRMVVSENLVINDGSIISILGDLNYSHHNLNVACDGYSHCINGSILISNSSNVFIGNGSLSVGGYLDLIGSDFILGENLVIGKSVVSTRKSNFFIKEGDLIIQGVGMTKEKKLEHKSFLISNSVFLINGKLIVWNGDAAIIMKSYLEAKQAYIEGSLGMSTKSLLIIYGDKMNSIIDLTFKGIHQINLLVYGNMTADTFSEVLIFEGSISIEAIILASGSKISVKNKVKSKIDPYRVIVDRVVVLQGNSLIDIPEGYIVNVNSGILVDEFSIMTCNKLRTNGDLFTDDGGSFFANTVEIFYPSTLVSQDSSKINIEHLQILYSKDESTLVDKSEFSDIPLFISENGGSIHIHRCEYSCEELKCILSHFGIRTVESIISIKNSSPGFIPIRSSVQFFELNSTKHKELYEVIDPIAFIIRKNPEERRQIKNKSKITFSKGEQVRRGRTWDIDDNKININNESHSIQWQ
ncbi:putative signal peptide-containing protein [Cryptosporidium canis]|uniref:Signal peptide-containing protein n=1 Tax=Cryptosporidium canis TaxID=195482 RepID=A0A9D5DM77_9CRYT|nr:putative signal peptide-containing protein [Cryptosporidium canis]